MEEKLLKLFKLADELNNKQNKVYAEIKYIANDSKKLEICIRTKEKFEYIEECKIQLKDNSIMNWNKIVSIFENFVGGIANE